MSGPGGASGLIVSFPAAGHTRLAQMEKIAARRGAAHLSLRNPASVAALQSGEWSEHCLAEAGRARAGAPGGHVLLAGHSMGGLSAVTLRAALAARLGRPPELLLVNTPCPDSSGRIPTMSHMKDTEIAEILARDGFPQDLLDDEGTLAEIADGLREDAVVADHLAERTASHAPLDTLHVLSARGDAFIPAERCAAWDEHVSGDFHLTFANGGHSLDAPLTDALARAVDAVLVRAEAGVA
ncbi:thioesterase domain-containing protein [Streptomyces sp. ODS28]|uniref:thioesterase II family protein n=1 Tax=Streptomyces sp. ODS28 TaxID=3136688 RepID=UPI0031ED7976